LGAIAHRLSQPFTALQGSMEVALLAERNAAEYRAALEQAFHLVEFAVRLLSSLRDLAETAAPMGVRSRVPMGELIQRVVEELRILTEAQGLGLLFEHNEELFVEADAQSLYEALLKLVYAAAHRSQRDGVLRLALSKSHGEACLTLADPRLGPCLGELATTGAAPIIGSLFAEATQGGCLDWVIARQRIEAMGGTLVWENEPPAGSRYVLRLQLAESA
jgi:C4-dicarboxylate-specific signal transduction histidine kinase